MHWMLAKKESKKLWCKPSTQREQSTCRLWQSPSLDELWIAFGCAKSFRYIAVHDIAASLESERCQALSFFHAFTLLM